MKILKLYKLKWIWIIEKNYIWPVELKLSYDYSFWKKLSVFDFIYLPSKSSKKIQLKLRY